MSQTEITWETLGSDHIAASSGVFLVAGKTSFAKSGAEEKLNGVLDNKNYTRFSSFTENPKLAEISAGVAALKTSGCNLILAIGGGSAIDVAKAIYILASHKETDHTELLTGKKKLQTDSSSGKKLIAIPTTFGTGSESTHFAVIYIGDSKYSLAHVDCLPVAYILDPTLAITAPAAIRASTGIDALCQAIESYWAVGATNESRTYAAKAIPLLRDNLEAYVNNEKRSVAALMAKAANLSGRSINISKTTAPHALSYGITKLYGVPHGQAVALTLPSFFKINFERGDTRIKTHMQEIFELLAVQNNVAAKTWFINLLSAIGLKKHISDITNISANEATELARQVNLERLSNHPVKLSESDLIAALLS